ncbi:MAG: hypothetical protein GY853_10360 [PVC group bacterium]|nr:hypothetical protein [PVC group bacterium]
MAHEKPYWLPNEKDVGQKWRHLYNKYMTQEITFSTYEKLLLEYSKLMNLDVKPSNIAKQVKSLQYGYHLLMSHGEDIFNSICEDLRDNNNLGSDKSDIDKAILGFELFFIKKKPTLIDDPYDLFMQYDNITTDLTYDLTTLDKKKNNETMIVDRPSDWSAYESFIHDVPCYLEFIMLKELVNKVFGGNDSQQHFDLYEHDMIVRHYSKFHFGLASQKNDNDLIDPSSIELIRFGVTEWVVPPNLPDLFVTHEKFMEDFISDFIDELIAFNRHHSVKGSSLCIECGQMYPRSFYGHGQKYCSTQCKERAKQRRKRERKAKGKFKIDK